MERVAERPRTSVLDLPLLSMLRLNWELVLYITFTVLAIATRFWDLGSRAMSHDESLHTQYSWQLYVGKGYQHNPMMHGPFKFHLTALIYFLFGDSDYTSRIGPALFGVILVILPYFLRKWLGRWGALVTSFLLLISPTILYYSRYIRDEIFMLVWMMLMVIALFRYLDERQGTRLHAASRGVSLEEQARQERWFYLGVVALSLSIATMEVAYIHGFLGLTFLMLTLGYEFAFGGEERPLWDALRSISSRTILVSVAIFVVIYVVLFTTFFTNPAGLAGIPASISYWLAQQPVQRGSQPWYYYMILAPLYEFTPLLFSLVGAIVYLLRGDWRLRRAGDTLAGRLFVPFLLWWLFLAWVIFTWAGEKMPWLTVYLALPMSVLAGRFLGDFVDSVDWQAVRQAGGIMFALLLIPTVITFGVWVGLRPFRGMSLQRLGETMQWLASLVVLLILLSALWRYGQQLGAKRCGQVMVVCLAGVLALFTVRAAWVASYINDELAVEMLVYAHGTPDVKLVQRELQELGQRLGQGYEMKVSYDNLVPWPFEWYLRDYKNRNYFGEQPAGPLDAPVVLVGVANEDKVKPYLGNNYVRREYRLIWWPIEDYKFGGNTTPRNVLRMLWKTLTDPQMRSSAFKIWMWRDYGKPMDAWPDSRFAMYVRKDVVSRLWEYGAQAPELAAVEDEYDKRRVQVSAIAIWGSQGSGPGQLINPKDLALDAEGNIYVVDSGNSRVVKFDPTGKFITQWGSNGTAAGQFKDDPWGIAVDSEGGFVYVADTWNHRIQKFTLDGEFVTQWGSFVVTDGSAVGEGGRFYGPRDIAIDAEGNLYVTDTGNKRIQKFNPDGQFLGQWGGVGFAPGQFNEPVGIAISPTTGDIFVADTWNRRVQRLDRDFNPLAQWPVRGWAGESVNNKPYLALDSEDNVYVTDPESYQVYKFDNQGRLLAVFGQFGTDARSFNLPTGITVDQEGYVYITDSFNHRVMKFGPVPGQ